MNYTTVCSKLINLVMERTCVCVWNSEFENLPKFIRRSPYPERDNITVYKRRDVEQKWTSSFSII